MAKKKPLPKSKAKTKAKPSTKKPITNANKKTYKQKKAKQPIGKGGPTGNKKAIGKQDKTRSKAKDEKPVELVSKIGSNKKSKSVEPIASSNKRTKPASVRTIKTKENKQTNSITFLSGGKPENVSKKFVKGKDAKLIKKYLTKNKPKKGAPAKEPRAVILIFAYNGSEGKKHYSVVSPDTMVVNADSIDKFISDTLENANDLVDDLYGTNLEDFSIVDYSIKFIY